MALGYADDSALFERLSILGDNRVEVVVYSFGSHAAEAENDNTGQSGLTGRDQFAKVKIVGQENEPFTASLLQNVGVWQLVKALVMQMHSIVAETVQESHRLRGNTHVCQESHAGTGSSGWMVSSASHAAY